MDKTFKVTLGPDFFDQLGDQNLSFTQCLNEWIDNALAATKPNTDFDITIYIDQINDSNCKIYICDKGCGLSPDEMERAFGRLGESVSNENRLNEHGMGLKSSIAVCTRNHSKVPLEFSFSSRKTPMDNVFSISGILQEDMIIRQSEFPTIPLLNTEEFSSILSVTIPMSFANSVKETVRGKEIQTAETLSKYITEDIGVYYKHYLNPNKKQNGKISIGHGKSPKYRTILPIMIKYLEIYRNEIRSVVDLNGCACNITCTFGLVNKNDMEMKTSKYYQNTLSTSGVDIVLNQRTVLISQLELIWPITNHPGFNKFIGEIIIENAPKGTLRTSFNKTDILSRDETWEKLFSAVQNIYVPSAQKVGTEEKELKEKLKKIMDASLLGDGIVTQEKCVLDTGVKIDLYYESTKLDKIVVYEVKVNMGDTMDLAQLRMYWDGIAQQQRSPTHGILVAKNFIKNIDSVINYLNTLKDINDNNYNFSKKTLSDYNL